MEDKNNFKRIRVLVKQIEKTADHEAFPSYKLVGEGGRLIDLRMCRNVDTRLFEGMKKFEVDALVEDASARYEYPRAYCKAIAPDTIEQIA